MTKRIAKLISLTLALCMFFSTAVLAEEPETVRDMTYEEWLVEQENVSDSASAVELDMEPVKVVSQEQEVNDVPQTHREENTGITLLDSILEEKGAYELGNEINRDRLAYDVTDSISSDGIMELSAPTAGLIPIIYNEDSLVNGEISTDTVIVFFFNDTVDDDVTIAGRYVDGSAVNYILGEIDGGFVMQITEPGSYQLYYQIEDSTGAFSRAIGYSFTVVAAPVVEKYQVFEGSFSSASDSVTYNFSIDFTEMDSAAVCLVRKGYVGISIKVYDEGGNQLFARGTGSRQAKNWGFIDKPSGDATICNYTVVVTPSSYENRASDYRIIIGDKNDTELMMSGIENTVLLDQYYESKVNLQNSAYVPNVGEYWYKYKRESTSVITVLSDVTDIRFKIFDLSLNELFDSAKSASTHRTSFTGNGGWICAEKARLTTVVGTEYYLVVYSTNPNASLSLRSGSMATAVGNPVMCGGSAPIIPGRSVTARSSSYSSTTTFVVSGDNLPDTAQVREVSLGGVRMSQMDRWRMQAPNLSSWSYNQSSHYPSIDMGYKVDTSGNALLKGTWGAAFMSSTSSSLTFTPSYTFYYYYEYGD